MVSPLLSNGPMVLLGCLRSASDSNLTIAYDLFSLLKPYQVILFGHHSVGRVEPIVVHLEYPQEVHANEIAQLCLL